MFTKRNKTVLVRQYRNRASFEKGANRLVDQGYEITEVNGQRPNVALGKTALHALFTGGIGLVIGGRAYKKGTLLVTYRKARPQPIAQTNVAITLAPFGQPVDLEGVPNDVAGGIMAYPASTMARLGRQVYQAVAVGLIGVFAVALIVLIMVY